MHAPGILNLDNKNKPLQTAAVTLKGTYNAAFSALYYSSIFSILYCLYPNLFDAALSWRHIEQL